MTRANEEQEKVWKDLLWEMDSRHEYIRDIYHGEKHFFIYSSEILLLSLELPKKVPAMPVE